MVAVLSRYPFIIGLAMVLLTSCFSEQAKEKKSSFTPNEKVPVKEKHIAPHFTGKKVPVLCYHAIREIQKGDSPNQKTYSVSPGNFAAQIKALADNGYTTITPDDLKDFMTTQKPLPAKPVMITFDDGRNEQYSIGAGILEKYHFKGVFFIMTVTLGKQNYMSPNQIKTLSDRGHIIGSHTWDHHKVTDYDKEDWKLQISKPKKQLEKITQKPVTCFSYPYGVWNNAAADSLKANGFTTAFIFYGKQDPAQPLYTIERINVTNTSTIDHFLKTIEKTGMEVSHLPTR